MNGKVQDYRFDDEKRKNIPDAGLASYYKEKREHRKYEYDPHLDPQLVWAGKVEHESFEVDTVALHIHERISSKAILKTVEKRELFKQLRLFGEPDLPLDKRIEFYQHDMDWTNRLILGDSLLVMNSLLEREMMAEKVQMIYIDPPYGVSYSSNFQPAINQTEVKDGKDESLTREIEQIKAYRDTWVLGIHSYLAYLRDRLLLCRDLLADTGSIFVQIGDDNVHHVRELMSEIFGERNFCALITFRKTGWKASTLLSRISDYLVWFAKDKEKVKFHPSYLSKLESGAFIGQDIWIENDKGLRKRLTAAEVTGLIDNLPEGHRLFRHTSLTSAGYSETSSVPFEFKGKKYSPGQNQHWKTTPDGLQRLANADRLLAMGNSLRFISYLEDFPVSPLTSVWTDTAISGFSDPKLFVVQTNTKVIARCILMTTDPADLVLDPTCGSGTTAYVAEQFGRRWITCDTSRVALALARQRLLCAVFPFYKLAYPEKGVSGGFVYENVPHITLKTVAQGERPDTETIYDKPVIDKDRVRVSGPLTVEAIPVPSVEDPSVLSTTQSEAPNESLSPNVAEDYVGTMIDLVRKDGVTRAPKAFDYTVWQGHLFQVL